MFASWVIFHSESKQITVEWGWIILALANANNVRVLYLKGLAGVNLGPNRSAVMVNGTKARKMFIWDTLQGRDFYYELVKL